MLTVLIVCLVQSAPQEDERRDKAADFLAIRSQKYARYCIFFAYCCLYKKYRWGTPEKCGSG